MATKPADVKLSLAQVQLLVAQVFTEHDQHTIDTMSAIIMAESAGVVNAFHDNIASGHQDEGSAYHSDYGLAQINSVHGYDPGWLVSDPMYNLEAAKSIWERQGFNAWSAFKANAHKVHMPTNADAILGRAIETVLNETDSVTVDPDTPARDWRLVRLQKTRSGVDRFYLEVSEG